MSEKSKNSVSLIIPVYNEEVLVKDALNECLAKLAANFEEYELIVVDDGSKDNTKKIILENFSNSPNVVFCPNYINLNQGVSIQRALAIATKKYVVHNGIDLPLDINDLRKSIDETPDADMIVFQRTIYSGATSWRKLTSNINILIRRILFPKLTTGIPDMNFTQVYTKQIIPFVMPLAKSPAFTTPEMIMRARLMKYTIQLKEIHFHARQHGSGSLGKLHDILWTIYDMFRFRHLLWMGIEKHGKVK